MIFIHKTLVVKSHPKTRAIRELLGPRSTPGKHGLFLHEQIAHLHAGNTQQKVLKIVSDEDIIENNDMFVMFWNLSVISHLFYP